MGQLVAFLGLRCTEKSRRSLLAQFFARSLHTHQGNPKGPRNLALRRIPIGYELAAEKPKRSQVLRCVLENWQMSVERPHRSFPLAKGDLTRDWCAVARKDRKLNLRHATPLPQSMAPLNQSLSFSSNLPPLPGEGRMSEGGI
jgi:hypothetical protein